MVSTVLDILLGVLVVVAITTLTGYFVAQEFGYMAVDRARLRVRASAGDTRARRALAVTGRTSFMLSGAQLGITVTGLVVGYVAEPLIGASLGALFGVAGVPTGISLAAGTVLALLFATVVQMVFGELFPKNLAIARPEPVARALAASTTGYLAGFGWLIRIFDQASTLLLRALRIEPVHDVEHASTARDLAAIIGESRDSGDLTPELSTVLDRVLGFTDRTAETAMIPRPQVDTVPADSPLREVLRRMATGHSRYPVTGAGVDDVLGVVGLRDLLALAPDDLAGLRAGDVAREALFVPASLALPEVVARLRPSRDQFACVLDEYGGLAGVITLEDVAEELVGEITDEHDPEPTDGVRGGDGHWSVPGSLHIDEVRRLLDHDLPHGGYHTIGGLVITRLARLPRPGDRVRLTVPGRPDGADGPRVLELTVAAVRRRVPQRVELSWSAAPATPAPATPAPATPAPPSPGPGSGVEPGHRR